MAGSDYGAPSAGAAGGGDASAANQVTGNNSLASIDAKTPSSPATSGKQDTGNTSLASIDSKTPASPATSGKQDTGNTSLASIDGKLGSLGQKASAGSAPVVLASDQPAIPVNATLAAGAATVGKVDQGTGGASAWKVDGSAVTQPISAVALPLPANAAAETGGNLALIAAKDFATSTKQDAASAYQLAQMQIQVLALKLQLVQMQSGSGFVPLEIPSIMGV